MLNQPSVSDTNQDIISVMTYRNLIRETEQNGTGSCCLNMSATKVSIMFQVGNGKWDLSTYNRLTLHGQYNSNIDTYTWGRAVAVSSKGMVTLLHKETV